MGLPAAPPCETCGRESSRTTYTGTDPENPVPFTCILHSQAGTAADPYHLVMVRDVITETPTERIARLEKEKRIKQWKERDETNARRTPPGSGATLARRALQQTRRRDDRRAT